MVVDQGSILHTKPTKYLKLRRDSIDSYLDIASVFLQCSSLVEFPYLRAEFYQDVEDVGNPSTYSHCPFRHRNSP